MCFLINLLNAGVYTHNQKILKIDIQKFVNPHIELPKKRNLVVAIIDDGVDYNLPTIQEKLYFNGNGDFGYDFVGEDTRPHPYIGRSMDYDLEAETFWSEKYIKSVNKDNDVKLDYLQKLFPSKKSFLNKDRVIKHELLNLSFHETQIASLYSKIPGVRLLSYRVLPYSLEFADKGNELLLGSVLYRQRFLNSLKMAIKDGANVISISHGFDFYGSFNKSSSEMERFEKKMASIIEKNSQVLFIAASGNSSKQLSPKRIEDKMLPCTIDLKNVLCVGGKDWNKSNIVYDKKEFVKEKVTDIKVLNPLNMCTGKTAIETLSMSLSKMKIFLEVNKNKIDFLNSCKSESIVEGTSYSVAFALKSLMQIIKNNNIGLMDALEIYLESSGSEEIN